jgi:hypothetical protein
MTTTQMAAQIATIDTLRAEARKQGRIGTRADGSAIYPEGERSPLEIGERVFPLGMDGGGGDVEPLPC